MTEQRADIVPRQPDRSGYATNPVLPRLTLTGGDVRPETIRHHLNRYRLAASHVREGDVVVDICSGTGYGTDMMKEAGARVAIGVDLSSEGIAHARATYPRSRFIEADATLLLAGRTEAGPVTPNVITFFEAIEHLPREVGGSILDSAQLAMDPEGILFVSTPRDIRSDVNRDHITQWEFEELDTALRHRFEKVELFGQDWATGEFVYEQPENSSFYVAKSRGPKRTRVD